MNIEQIDNKDLFFEDTKMIVVAYDYCFVSDFKITKLDNDYIIQMKNCRFPQNISMLGYSDIKYESCLYSKSLIVKELKVTQLKEIPEWINRTEDEASKLYNEEKLKEALEKQKLKELENIVTLDLIQKQNNTLDLIRGKNKPLFIKKFFRLF